MKKIVLVILMFNCSAFGQVGTLVDATGGAGVAVVHPIDSAFMNPATIPQLKSYHVGAQYFRNKVNKATTLDQYGLVITDATGNGIARGSLSYRYRDYEQLGNKIREDVIQFSLATFLTRSLSIGLNGYHVKTDFKNGINYAQKNIDLGLLWVLDRSLALGIVQRGIMGSEDRAIFTPSLIRPSTTIGGQYFVSDMVKIRGDLTYTYENNPDQRLSHNLGAEFVLRGGWSLRTGLSIDDFKAENRYSFGFGWLGPKLKVAYAYQKEFRQEFGGAHTVDFHFDI